RNHFGGAHVVEVHWVEPITPSSEVVSVLAMSGVGGATVSAKICGVMPSSLACLTIATPSARCTEPTMTCGFLPLILVSADDTSDVPLGTYSSPTTWKPRLCALATPALVTVLEKPSSADTNATVAGFGLARSAIASSMTLAYCLAGDRTAKVRLYPFWKILSSAPALSAMTWPLRSMTAAAASVVAEPYGPRISLTPLSLNWSTSCAAVSGFDVSSWYWICNLPSLPPTATPPLAFTTSAHTSYPSLVSAPSRASEPVSDIDAPSASVPVSSALLPASPLEPQALVSSPTA